VVVELLPVDPQELSNSKNTAMPRLEKIIRAFADLTRHQSVFSRRASTMVPSIRLPASHINDCLILARNERLQLLAEVAMTDRIARVRLICFKHLALQTPCSIVSRTYTSFVGNLFVIRRVRRVKKSRETYPAEDGNLSARDAGLTVSDHRGTWTA